MVQAIINSTNNNWLGFPFLFAICTAASIVVWLVDIEKGRKNCQAFVEKRKLLRTAKESGMTAEEVVEGAQAGKLWPTTES